MDFHYTQTTKKTVDEAVQALTETLKANKFGVLWQLDIPATLQSKGVDFTQPYRVLEVCNPHEAKKVLTQNPLVGYFLPCKIVVFQDADQTTRIGMPRPTMLMEIIQDPALKSIAEGVEEAMVKSIQEAL